MPNLFRIESESKNLIPLAEQDFSSCSFLERYDIQEWIASTPDSLGEPLLIIAKEDSCFSGTNERPDLVALDKQGNIVVIELKRDDSGIDVHWQAIKYAAYWSSFSKEEILNRFKNYLTSVGKLPDKANDEDLLQIIGKFVGNDEIEFNNNQRIILVSHRFAKEVITAVHWLVERGTIHISCVSLTPFFDQKANTHYLQVNKFYPTPEISEFLVKPRTEIENHPNLRTIKNSNDSITKFFRDVDVLVTKEIPATLNYRSKWAGGYPNWRYYHFYRNDWNNWNLSFKLWLYTQNNEYKGESECIRVIFYLQKDFLKNKGWDEDRINNLIKEIKDSQKDLISFESSNEFYIEKVVPFQINNKENLARTIILFINGIYPIIEKQTT